MSPQFIIILTASLCSLLIIVLLVLRKKNKQKENPSEKNKASEQKTKAISETEEKTPLENEELLPDNSLEALSSLNLDDLEIDEIKNTPMESKTLPSNTNLKKKLLSDSLENPPETNTEAILPYENTTIPVDSPPSEPEQNLELNDNFPESDLELDLEDEKDPFIDLIELVNRYKFFQGKNLEKFEKLLRESNSQGIENLIREKFLAQGKEDSAEKAHSVAKKLLASIPSSQL